MGGAERVECTLAAPREAGEAAAFANRANAVAPPGENFGGIGLMADIPDQPVVRRVEHVVQRYRQLDDTQSRAEVAARLGAGVDEFVTKLFGELIQICPIEPAQIGRDVNLVE